MQKIIFTFLVASALFFICGSQTIFACFCPGDEYRVQVEKGEISFDGRKHFADFNGAIFLGTVVSVRKVKEEPTEQVGLEKTKTEKARSKRKRLEIPSRLSFKKFEYLNYYEVTFKVEQHWIGAEEKEVKVFTGKDGAACGIHFVEGKSYLVFARLHDSKLKTGICDWTKNKEHANNLIIGLGNEPFKKTP